MSSGFLPNGYKNFVRLIEFSPNFQSPANNSSLRYCFHNTTINKQQCTGCERTNRTGSAKKHLRIKVKTVKKHRFGVFYYQLECGE